MWRTLLISCGKMGSLYLDSATAATRAALSSPTILKVYVMFRVYPLEQEISITLAKVVA